MKKLLALILVSTLCVLTPSLNNKVKADSATTSMNLPTANDSFTVVDGDTVWNPKYKGDASVTEDTFKGYSKSIATLAFAVMLIVALVRKMKTGMPTWAIQVVSWITGPVLALIFYGLHWGMFDHITLFQTLFAGILSALVANGMVSSFVAQAIYNTKKN